ncbi:hypothetical protein P43SY_004205 [Pythium insidiosum]|uniref:Ubiquitin-like domain-containing protein n=1 Tax=Pythium insidiosum TaxID=114742 RepID=A0AAD5LCS3_PYTIN|nr:hypothetical protein P43SY_004205 [Pythium insidiosum]
MTDVVELSIKVVGGASETLAVRVEGFAAATVLSLKQCIEQQSGARFPVAAQRLIFQGQILQNDKRLSEYNIQSGMAVHLTLTPGASRPAAATAASPSPSPAASVASISAAETLRGHLQSMRFESGADVAVQTLQKICENIISHPTEDKYRKLRVANAALQARLFDRSRGMACVQALGFQDGVEAGHLVLVPTAERWENLVACKRVLDEFAGASPSFASPFASPSPSALPSFPPGGGVDNMLAMLQNPMMAQMLQSHPMMQQLAQVNPMAAQVLQNPAMLSQTLQMMQQNPQMMQQVNQMMQNPSAMQQMQQMMLGGGGSNAFASPLPTASANNPFAPATASASAMAAANPFAPSAATATATAPAQPSPSPSPSPSPLPSAAAAESAATDAATFDEDEIARAIARSMEEQ